MNHKELLAMFGALDLGIIPMNGECIDTALNSLSTEENRRVRRKYRKLKRKLMKKDPALYASIRENNIKRRIRSVCVERGRKIINGS